MSWFIVALKKYAVFSGRARRKEYWMYTLFYVLISYLAMGIITGIVAISAISGNSNPTVFIAPIVLFTILYLAFLIPTLAVTVRRLHDTSRSGWWYFISFIPFVGGIILIVFLAEDSKPGDNQYGPNPKGVEAFEAEKPGLGTVTSEYAGDSANRTFHKLNCTQFAQIETANIVWFSSQDEAKNAGYASCEECKS
jgi:uncharacterized membrane protein YhaH (DUF805 family)